MKSVKKLTPGDVASQVGLSPDYFGKLFRVEPKHLFSEYLKRLLKSGKAFLGDIAYAFGFEDQSYFTRVFRKSVGTTPSRYRDTDKVFLDGDCGIIRACSPRKFSRLPPTFAGFSTMDIRRLHRSRSSGIDID